MKPQSFFAIHPVFTYAEFASALRAKERSGRTLDSLLAYHTRTGRLLRVRRGLYMVVPPGTDAEKCPVDAYLVAARLTGDAVLAYHTALEFHGQAHSVLEHFFYFTAHRSRPLTFRGCRFRAVPFPESLRRRRKEFAGVDTADRAGVNVRVTGLERTLVDVLDRPDLAAGWEETWRSLESIEFLDLDKVTEYALLLENATTAAKVGFFLESRRKELMVGESHLERLRKRKPREPHYLARRPRRPGRLVREWNLVVPIEILDRVWEETR